MASTHKERHVLLANRNAAVIVSGYVSRCTAGRRGHRLSHARAPGPHAVSKSVMFLMPSTVRTGSVPC